MSAEVVERIEGEVSDIVPHGQIGQYAVDWTAVGDAVGPGEVLVLIQTEPPASWAEPLRRIPVVGEIVRFCLLKASGGLAECEVVVAPCWLGLEVGETVALEVEPEVSQIDCWRSVEGLDG